MTGFSASYGIVRRTCRIAFGGEAGPSSDIVPQILFVQTRGVCVSVVIHTS